MTAKTPMMRQYCEAKGKHPDALLAMRVGDFYEFYGPDAETAAAALEITLTGREDGKNGRIPMAGVPYHAVDKYVARLVRAGHKVALCDQVEDPKAAKGLVRREVTRVVSAGTALEDAMLDAGTNNFLAAISVVDGKAGLATLDPSTGEFLVTQVEGEGAFERLLQELARVRPAELLAGEGDGAKQVADAAKQALATNVRPAEAPVLERAETHLMRHFSVGSLAPYGCADQPGAVVAASMVLAYAAEAGLELGHVESLATYSTDNFMRLDMSTRSALEITRNARDGGKTNTLLECVDRTVTAMGARSLRRWLEQPLTNRESIEQRSSAVARLAEHAIPRGELRAALDRMGDIERLTSRCSAGIAGPRDLAALRDALQKLPHLDDAMRKLSVGHLQELRERIGDHRDLVIDLKRALVDDPPHSVRDAGIFRDEWDDELGKLRELARDGRRYIAELEATERERTGLERLKVGYNAVFGYYLEVSRAHADRVPERYIRKQTLAAAERYITAELKEHESHVLGADDRARGLEGELFGRLRARVARSSCELLRSARAIAELDSLASLAEVALASGWVRPEIVEDDALEITAGRHPVVEATTPAFVPNNLALGEVRCVVLTGPNMSGKSTYLRQAAIIVLLAHVGSFVPAAKCRLGLCDRIFTRIGARDELAMGQSTFMVEMLESAAILNNATERSLVVLDEVGRGTSTFDGLAIAWSMIERLASVGAKTLFATHYHQLNALADQVRGVANFRVAVEESGGEAVWTHRVQPGGADRSYGIQVARMAGVPGSVLARAEQVLADLEQSEAPAASVSPEVARVQMTLFEAAEPEVVKALREVEVESLTPVEALIKLKELSERAR